MRLRLFASLIALTIPCAVSAAVNPDSPSSVMANVVYSGCDAATKGKADASAIDYWLKGASQYGQNPSFDKMYKDMIEKAVLQGSRFHRENPTQDCSQLYINVIDSLFRENEALKKKLSN